VFRQIIQTHVPNIVNVIPIHATLLWVVLPSQLFAMTMTLVPAMLVTLIQDVFTLQLTAVVTMSATLQVVIMKLAARNKLSAVTTTTHVPKTTVTQPLVVPTIITLVTTIMPVPLTIAIKY